jgi:soluble lytic murein transglycosylase
MSAVSLALVFLMVAPAKGKNPTEGFADALVAFRRGDYAKAASGFAAHGSALEKNKDYLLHFTAESAFYAGDYAKAASTFAALAKMRDSRFAQVAAWRAADCSWMQGKRSEAAAAYRKLVGGKSTADQAVGRYRMAEVLAEDALAKKDNKAAVAAAARAFMQIHVDFPAHPLGVAAGQRAAELAPAGTAAEARGEPSPQERLQRAAALSKSHHWQEALDELVLLPATLPADLGAQRDLAMGMAKYHARKDYAGAAELLLNVSTRLAGEKAAFAAFHGARALSRIDRDAEAIANYRNVVAKYPTASWAAEAQFRAGWLEINRGHFREALPDLKETLFRYPHSSFADDAAWYVALAYYLIGDSAQAMRAISTYEQVARRTNEDAAMRVRYWRARIAILAGDRTQAAEILRDCVTRSPFNYYGLLARARLQELGESLPWPTISGRGSAPKPLHDPAVERAFELEQSGLLQEAGIELERNEAGVIKRNGKAQTVPFLLFTYPRLWAFRRAQQLAESVGEDGVPDARLYWQAAYPRAYADAVESYGKSSGNPDLFPYAIMRKESNYYPFALSSSDARGLLQLIPTTGGEVAKKLGLPGYPDELFDPDTNIRLGTAYLGGLYRRFQNQEALAAGAYNAGAHAMMRWCDQWGTRPFDEFVELITYDQAREYIKRVLGIYARYRHLYGQPLALPLTVNPRYLKDGPDY